MQEHTVKAFDEDITRLRGLIGEMGGLAEVAIEEALASLVAGDTKRAEKVVKADKKLDDLESQVDKLAIRVIALRAPMADVRQRRARQHPARKAVDALAFGLVIGIEHEGPALVEQRISAEMVAQQEGFPEPRGVRQMPFGGAGIFHRLDRRIGFGQRRGQRLAQRAGRGVATLDFLSQRGLRLRLDLVQCRSP